MPSAFSPSARGDFLQMISRPDDELDLAVAALLIAKEEYPDLDVDSYRGRLDDLAAAAAPRVAACRDNSFAAIDALNTCLFVEQRFRGNQEEYFDPRNSYLNEVLERRRGIPITLSLIYMEVSARVGFPVEGVGFPGHFLVRHVSAGREILIDPFHAGEILMPEDCRKLLKASYGLDADLDARFFRAAGKKQILVRMLQNLKGIHLKKEDFARALSDLDRLRALDPAAAEHLRDRGLAHMRLGNLASARSDLEAYLRAAPHIPDEAAVRKQVRAIGRLTAMLN